jgi:hypothetical protein
LRLISAILTNTYLRKKLVERPFDSALFYDTVSSRICSCPFHSDAW